MIFLYHFLGYSSGREKNYCKKTIGILFSASKGKKILSILLVGQKPEPEDGSEPETFLIILLKKNHGLYRR